MLFEEGGIAPFFLGDNLMHDLPKTPKSAVASIIGWLGLLGFSAGITLILRLELAPSASVILLLLATGAPMWWAESRRFSNQTDAPGFAPQAFSTRGLRLRGLLVASMPWLATGLLFHFSRNVSLGGFWEAMALLWPGAIIALWIYLRIPPNPEPVGIEKLGRWLSHRQPLAALPWPLMRDQLVKAFFLPLMFAFSYDWTARVLALSAESDGMGWYWTTLALLYLVDTTFGTLGYLSTSSRLGAQIRSSNPYWSGWVSALVCYPPFFVWLTNAGFNYRDGYEWQHWLGVFHPSLVYAWGGTVLLLTVIYAWATVVFGIRFSNLTNRGIITHGPYRYTKHPAYLAKNVSWWLISIPFVAHAGAQQALLGCLILATINAIYWIRAKTEEKHLMHDADYRHYAAWIKQFGLLARLRRFFHA